MGHTTSHPVRNPTLILQRNAKKRCSNLAERGDAWSHVPRHVHHTPLLGGTYSCRKPISLTANALAAPGSRHPGTM